MGELSIPWHQEAVCIVVCGLQNFTPFLGLREDTFTAIWGDKVHFFPLYE